MNAYVKILLVFLFVIIFVVSCLTSVFFVSFKTDYKDIVFENSESTGVDMSLIFTVIKAESKFDKNVKSKAGAIGLMQIKLSTANYVLSMDDEDEITENDLFLPEINIKIGTKYLKYLINKFENLDVAICAYNAGETTVKSWLKSTDYSSDNKTLKKIPYAETQTYLSRVKFNQKVYSKIL